MTKRLLAACLAAFLVFSLSACKEDVPALDVGSESVISTPAPTEEPQETPAADAPGEAIVSSFKEQTLFFPEGSDTETADYVLTYSLPLFPEGDGRNEAVSLYEEELIDRVREERLPLADRVEGEAAPSTAVSWEVTDALLGGSEYTAILFLETVYFGEAKEVIPHALVLDSAGTEYSFAALSGQYEPEALVAQQIFNEIDRNGDAYYADIAPEDVRLALDLVSGFTVSETGYTFYIRAGVLAPEEQGILSFTVERSALYPAAVGDALSTEEYEHLLPGFAAIAAACAPNYEGFTGGSPSPYAASAFMTYMLTTGEEEGYFAEVTEADYAAAFASYFTGSLPGDLAALGDGTAYENGVYRIPIHPRAPYAFRMDDAVRTAEGLTVYGMLLSGTPGTAQASELAAVSLTLKADAAAPLGFRFDAVEFM